MGDGNGAQAVPAAERQRRAGFGIERDWRSLERGTLHGWIAHSGQASVTGAGVCGGGHAAVGTAGQGETTECVAGLRHAAGSSGDPGTSAGSGAFGGTRRTTDDRRRSVAALTA